MKMKWIKIGVLAASTVMMCAVFLKNKLDAAKSWGRQDNAPAELPRELASVIADGIQRHAPAFDGLYEGLLQAARNKTVFSTDAYEEWCIRAEHLADEDFSTAFCAVFSQSDIADERLCRKKFDSLLACIAQAGIFRMQENGAAYIADHAMCQAYQSIDGGKLEIGEEYTVLKSAWVSDTRTIEYGMAKPRFNKEGAIQP